jgi:transcriptional regulator with XRE-family HTH domain
MNIEIENPKRAKFDAALTAQRIKQVREDRGWSQKELGDLAGFSAANISHFERGRRDPGSRSLFALAAALLVSPAYLLGYHD